MRVKKTIITLVLVAIAFGFYWYASGYRLSEKAILNEFRDYYKDAQFVETVNLEDNVKVYIYEATRLPSVVVGDESNLMKLAIGKSFLGYKVLGNLDYIWEEQGLFRKLSYVSDHDRIKEVIQLIDGSDAKAYQLLNNDILNPVFEAFNLNINSEGIYEGVNEHFGYTEFYKHNELVAVYDGIYNLSDAITTSISNMEAAIDLLGFQKEISVGSDWVEFLRLDIGLSFDDANVDVGNLNRLGSIQTKGPSEFYLYPSGTLVPEWLEVSVDYYQSDGFVIAIKSTQVFEYDVDLGVIGEAVHEYENSYLIHPLNFTRIENFIEKMN